MAELLTPKQVATFRDWADLDPIVPNQELRSAIHALGIDWLTLQEQLAEAQADVRALADALTQELQDQIECNKEQWSELAETCPWDELLDSHAALRTDRDAWEATAKGYHARLAEVQADVQALVQFIRGVNINCSHCEGSKTRLLARPGVAKLLKGETP